MQQITVQLLDSFLPLFTGIHWTVARGHTHLYLYQVECVDDWNANVLLIFLMEQGLVWDTLLLAGWILSKAKTNPGSSG